MDGLASDIDVAFLLTTNRADLLEHALAARPGRVDHAAELPVPDAGARRRLIRLYQGSLELDLSDPQTVIDRTDGVTASFIKELLRRAALQAAEEEAPEQDDTERHESERDNTESDDAASPLRITDAHMTAALDQLLSSQSALTRVLLGRATAWAGHSGDNGSDS
jgi:cell division protease FtsH